MATPPLPTTLPFLIGVYVAVDAIQNAFLLVDGPYCTLSKAEMQYSHNLRCRLTPPIGRSRILHTARSSYVEEVAGLAANRTQAVEGALQEVCSWEEARVILTTSFDFHQLVEFPLQAITAKWGAATGKMAVHVPSRSLGGNWLDGYSAACTALAQSIPLAAGGRQPRTVALVGYLFDRDEPDHAANLTEIKRLLSTLGIETISVWLSGGTLDHLSEIRRTSLIVSLPYAREAAATLARRLNVDLVEAELPIGLESTERFIMQIAHQVGCEDRGRRMVQEEIRSAVRDTENHISRILAGATAWISLTDPHLASAVSAALREMGVRLATAQSPDSPQPPVEGHLLVLATSLYTPPPGTAYLPFGYPNYLDHPVNARPFLGFQGFRHLVEMMTSAVLRGESDMIRQAPPPSG